MEHFEAGGDNFLGFMMKAYDFNFVAALDNSALNAAGRNGTTALDAENIFLAYDENDWHDSKGNPIHNWKMKLRQVWCTPQSRKKEDPEVVAMRNLITPEPEEMTEDVQQLESMGFKL